jgi:Polyketide cyclase / dehydrase and lipid transport
VIRATGTILVDRPADEAFDFVADLSNEPTFNPDATDIRKTTPGPIGLGTTYEEDVKPLGHFVVRIDEYERPSLLGFDARNRRADILVRFRFTPERGKTRLDAEIEFQPKGALRLLAPLLRRRMKRMYEHERGPSLKRALEGRD